MSNQKRDPKKLSENLENWNQASNLAFKAGCNLFMALLVGIALVFFLVLIAAIVSG